MDPNSDIRELHPGQYTDIVGQTVSILVSHPVGEVVMVSARAQPHLLPWNSCTSRGNLVAKPDVSQWECDSAEDNHTVSRTE